MPPYLVEVFVFLLGLCIGSFLNVCIYRLPASQSIAYPGSKCQSCEKPIAFYDNIPVLSYLWLKGRCRHCGVKFSLRYPMVELLTGVAAWVTFVKFGLSAEALIYFIFIACLLVVTFIDLDHRIIPDVITLPGIPICFAASFLLPALDFKAALLGILVGGGSLFMVAWVYSLITKKDGMGGGDIKLLAMMGALLGWQGVVFTIFVSSLVGTLSGIALMLQSHKGMKLAVPFGPFLAIGGLTYIFFGTQLIHWYFNLLR
ncbi:Leader peptidase (Prepilin peptidase) (EC / N-methyltransferase (EC [Olavius algarvensis Delta 1 endosymbiont]|nr:Leader peptidase (Prepilin peptidase) (EC / N-methyltransferase (EC [Olavius algarvensis Delta 1 endosymbiont]